jgi:hypothetical protein
MIRLAADEDFDNDILRALLRRIAELDVVRVQDTGLSGADDVTVLEWAAREQRVLLLKTSPGGDHSCTPAFCWNESSMSK